MEKLFKGLDNTLNSPFKPSYLVRMGAREKSVDPQEEFGVLENFIIASLVKIAFVGYS